MLCPEELATLVLALSLAIAKGKAPNELSLLAVIFTQLADTLATIALQKEKIEDCKNNNQDNEFNEIPPL